MWPWNRPTQLDRIETSLLLLHRKAERIMATQAELTEQVNAATAKLTKIGTETTTLLTKIEELTAIINAGPPVSAELTAAVAALTAQAAVVDDLVPDA